MLVVSDTSPINYLVLIGHEGVLPNLFGRVMTTPAVIAELRHPRTPPRVREWGAHPPAWLEVRSPTAIDADLGLGKGETEAISLAREVHADAVLIDERNGSRAAARLGLVVTGTLGVLKVAGGKGLIHLPDALDALRSTTFRLTDRLIRELLDPDQK